MEIKISTGQILKILYVFSWMIFVGLCIEACGFLVNAVFALVNPAIVAHLWQQVDLSDLFKFDRGYFIVAVLIMSIVAGMKAWLFFLMIKILHNKNLKISHPFSKALGHFIFVASYITLIIGLFSLWGVRYTAWLTGKGIKMPDIGSVHLGGADVWLFMCVMLFIIVQIFKRGIEIQTENELTI